MGLSRVLYFSRSGQSGNNYRIGRQGDVATQSTFSEEQEQELSHALSAFSRETLFAVPSSSPEEDLAESLAIRNEIYSRVRQD